MIVVTAKLTVIPDKKAELLEIVRDLIAVTRQETGCISYSLFEDPYDPNHCIFLEEWNDKLALKNHLNTPHINEWRIKNKELLSAATELKVYEAEATKL